MCSSSTQVHEPPDGKWGMDVVTSRRYGRIDSCFVGFVASRRLGKGKFAVAFGGRFGGRPNFLYRDLRLPDERTRFGEGGRRAAAARVPASRVARRGAAGFLQYVQYPRKGHAQSFLAARLVRHPQDIMKIKR